MNRNYKATKRLYIFASVLSSLLYFSCSTKPKPFPKTGFSNLSDSMEFVLKRQQFYIEEAKFGEWLMRNKEQGQTFEEYWQQNPVRATEERTKIYIQLYGEFTPTQFRLMDSVQQFLSIFYQLPIERLENKSLDSILLDTTNWRVHKYNGYQIKTGFILNSLETNLPKDAILSVAFTTNDLYPNKKWSFVFGQARLYQRVGIWSMKRFGKSQELEKDTDAFDLALERTCKTAVHEIGHIFSIRHCISYRCVMQGSNNLKELDGHPTYFCPVCDAKIISNLNLSLSERYKKLSIFWKNQRRLESSLYYKKAALALKRLED